MPGPPIRGGGRIGGSGQRPMRRLTQPRLRRPVGRRPGQRMAEPRPGTELHQPRRLGGGARGGQLEVQLLRGRPQQTRISGGVGARENQQHPRIRGQLRHSGLEALLDPARHRRGRRQCEAAGLRQLEQGQRISTGLGEHPIPHPQIEGQRLVRGQQLARGLVVQATDHECGQLVQPTSAVLIAGGEHHRDRFGRDAPGDEGQHTRRGGVHPVRVIDDAQQWAFGRDCRQQLEGGQAGAERVRCRIDRTEGDQQCVAVRRGQRIEIPRYRRAQLVQCRERQFDLELRP